ncbi:MAG TPA: PEGA domain-containing protein, partial [Vicinamibacterales bacterium]
ADHPNSPATASADAQTRTGDDTRKTGDKAVTRDKDAEKKQKEADKKQKEETRRRADEDKKRGTAEPRDRDRKDGDDHATQHAVERPAQPVRRPPHIVDRTHVVFVGGYFYDPYFGEYPWWPPVFFPHSRIAFDGRAQVRLQVTPRETAVYVDGFYAGVVDDFDGFFQRLPLLSGGHTITLFLDGFGTITRRLYLTPGSDLSIREALVPLPPDRASEPPTLAAILPPPPDGSYIPPRTASRNPLPPPTATQQASVQATGYGLLSLRFRPSDAVVTIDGQEWISAAPGELVVNLAVGLHVVEVKSGGSRMFTTQIEILEGQTTELNVAARPTTW